MSISIVTRFRCEYISARMESVALKVLGGADLLVGGVRARIDTRKAIALAAYAAIEGPVSRDTLCALLWPEADDSRARSALRRTLSALRSASEDEFVLADRRGVALSDGVVNDVADFGAALAKTRSHDHADEDVCPRCVPLLQMAVDLYAGPFLDGFSLRDAPDFDDWTRVVAESLRGQVAESLERLSTGLAAMGDYHRATDAARRWVDLDSLHEPAHRNLMLISAWAGDRAGAIEAYRRCVAILNEELGVAPIAETTGLYEAILDEDLPPAPGQRRRIQSRAAAQPAPTGVVISRRREIEALESELVLARESSRLVILEGEPWMGRTHVLEEFSSLAAGRQHTVLLARAYEAERSLPYGVVVQLLRSALVHNLFDLAGLPDWVGVEIGRLLPELAVSSGPPSSSTVETRLFDATAAVLWVAAQDVALVVGVDDAEWIDEASASLLSYLTHQTGGPGLLVVLTTGLAAASPGRDAGLLKRPDARITLRPLAARDLADLVGDEEEARQVIEDTGGVPLLIVEHLRGADRSIVSAGMRTYVARRLESISEVSAQIASTAAVLGGAFDVGLLRSTSGRSEEEVIDAADELVGRQILREVPGTGPNLGFTLHAMERTVFESLSPIRRRLLHRRAADALQQSPRVTRDAGVAMAVADHLRLGGREDEAADWYRRAGDLAASLYATSEAERAYRTALEMGHPDQGEIQFALGVALLRQSRFVEALNAFQAAAAFGNQSLVARAEHRLGDVHRRLGRFEQAERHFGLAEEEHPTPDALFADWALLEFRQGNREVAEARARRAVDLAVARESRPAESRARDILGIVTESTTELERALALAGDDLEARMASLNSLAYAVAGSGDIEGAGSLVEEAIEIASAVGDRHRKAALLNHLADLHHRAGRDEESQVILTEAVRIFADLQPDAWEPEVWLLTRW